MSFNWRVFSNRLQDLNLNGSNLQAAEGTTYKKIQNIIILHYKMFLEADVIPEFKIIAE